MPVVPSGWAARTAIYAFSSREKHAITIPTRRLRLLIVGSQGGVSMKWFASAAAAALLSLSAGVAGAAEVVKVGLIADYTGAFAIWGQQFQQAIEAFQALNGKTVKGPDGKEIVFLFVFC